MVDKADTNISASRQDAKERIRNILKDYWIDYPQARKPVNAIMTILEVPIRNTAPCMLVCGEGGSGKTAIVQQLTKKNPALGSPMVFLSLVDNPGNLKFKQLILEALGLPTRLGSGRGVLPQEVAGYIEAKGVRALIIDEFHDSLLVAKNELQKNLSLLKGLSAPPYHLSVIGFGTKDARNALSSDPQLARRYYINELLPWNMDEDFRNFLATLEHFVKLRKPSNLHSEDMVRLIHRYSQGTMDNVVRLVKVAAIYAIVSGEEKITAEHLEKASQEPWGYNG
ncbi:transposase [Pseudomonas putida]|uniref:TniB family NTP-binding protein n=1 Tax=Pseudomonas putida TaxID=303 RepID=UPI000F7AD75E|nr:TniB family NTP-binding protein [Pseudomonas putida]RSC25933.1 transposase [Pseudomonas putida]